MSFSSLLLSELTEPVKLFGCMSCDLAITNDVPDFNEEYGEVLVHVVLVTAIGAVKLVVFVVNTYVVSSCEVFVNRLLYWLRPWNAQ